MNKILAWFITFNFIYITWIIFRAKDFESAMKVLGSMFSLDNIVLPEKYFKFLAEYNDIYFKFGTVYENILGESKTTSLIIIALLVVLIFKNSMEKMMTFKPSHFNLIYMIIILLVGISMMSNVSEFLYFNF